MIGMARTPVQGQAVGGEEGGGDIQTMSTRIVTGTGRGIASEEASGKEGIRTMTIATITAAIESTVTVGVGRVGAGGADGAGGAGTTRLMQGITTGVCPRLPADGGGWMTMTGAGSGCLASRVATQGSRTRCWGKK